MKTKILASKKVCLEVRINEDGTLWLSRDGETPITDAGVLIGSFGGIEAVLSRCIEIEGTFSDYKAERSARKAEACKQNIIGQANKVEADRIKANEAFEKIHAIHGDVIPATIDNIAIVARHLNFQNWGTWSLPRMSINYSASQYDCDGKTATTLVFDEPIDGDKRFVIGASRGHLEKYRRI